MRHEWATLIDKDKNRLLSDKLDLHGVKILYLLGLVFVRHVALSIIKDSRLTFRAIHRNLTITT